MSFCAPYQRPVYVMAKPAGASCNMHCDYCYYLEKANLYATPRHAMDDNLLELFIRLYIESQLSPYVLFTWHGGEPLLRPISFYEKALRLQRRYANGRQIDNAIQTNGTLITDDWARFFADNQWLVGVSIDGPEHIHNAYRHLHSSPSFAHVMQGIEHLERHSSMWNAMATVNHLSAQAPHDFYHFFKSIDCHYIQFTPVVERTDNNRLAPPDNHNATLTNFSVRPQEWGDFLCNVFDEWVRHDVGETFVQMFDATLANWVGVEPGVCSLSRHCGHVGALEHNGDLYCCDHFVFPEYRLGNIYKESITALMNSEKQNTFALQKTNALSAQCQECQWQFLCNGECPRNRFARDVYGNDGHNYLCEGYQQFWQHSAPMMVKMKELIENGREASEVRELF